MTISAVSGMMSLTGYQDGGPLGPGTHFPDHAANPYHAAFAVVAALRHRRLTGKGMKIDLAQVESTINCMGLRFTEFAVDGQEPERIGNRSRFHAPHNMFRCKGEDRWCAVAVLTDPQWTALCSVIGRADLAADKSLATAQDRLEQVDKVEEAVAQWTIRHDAVDVMTKLQAAGVSAGVVADSRFLMEEDAQLQHRGYWQKVDHPEVGVTRFTSPPYLIDKQRLALKRPPLLGEHSELVLSQILGYGADRIAGLRAEGVLE
jgi:benzylsuccinate CoA-transferase BbsF subunit